MNPHEFDIATFGECTTCGSDNPNEICAAPAGECDECGAWCEGNVCETCVRELGGES